MYNVALAITKVRDAANLLPGLTLPSRPLVSPRPFVYLRCPPTFLDYRDLIQEIAHQFDK